MAMVRWSPTSDLASLHSAMDRLFSDMFGDVYNGVPNQRGNGGARDTNGFPTYHLPLNIRETDRGCRIEAAVPGFWPEDVEVSFSEGILTINATRREERKEGKHDAGEYVRREVGFGHLHRQVSLAGDIRADDIKATFDNGMLIVDVPRAAKPQPRKVQITAGEKREAISGAGAERRR